MCSRPGRADEHFSGRNIVTISDSTYVGNTVAHPTLNQLHVVQQSQSQLSPLPPIPTPPLPSPPPPSWDFRITIASYSVLIISHFNNLIPIPFSVMGIYFRVNLINSMFILSKTQLDILFETLCTDPSYI